MPDCCRHPPAAAPGVELLCTSPTQPPVNTSLSHRYCYITVDSATAAIQNGACTHRCISKQRHYKTLFSHMKSLEIFENYITPVWKNKLFYNIISTQNQAWHIPKVIRITSNISNTYGTTPFCHVLCSGMHSNMMHRLMVQAF